MGKSQRSLQITIDKQTYSVDPGTTVLDAARKAGIAIPTLCHLDGCKPPASCMVCLVKDVKTGANLPSCATEVVDGMQIESETDEVHSLRRTALELLLSDHVGDCLAPCTVACPLHADIPSVVRLIRVGKTEEAARILRRQLPMTALLERLCAKPCEKACRRGRYDRAITISAINSTVTDQQEETNQSEPTDSGFSVAIVGGGLAGLAAAHFLRQSCHTVTIFEQADQPGGRLREEMVLAGLSDKIFDEELQRLERRGITFQVRSPIDSDGFEKLFERFNAVVVASGPRANDLFGERLKNPGCFTAGDAVQPEMPILRRATSGRDVAAAIDDFLFSGGACPRVNDDRDVANAGTSPAAKSVNRTNHTFTVRLGKLSEAEMNLFVEEVADLHASDMPAGLGEAARCFLCDCSDLAHCTLRQHAIEYGADPRRYKVPRRELTRETTPSGVVFESGKCIQCGRCIEILKKDPDAAGLTFAGRGFDVILATPIGRTLDEALGRVADDCCQACPTGALMKSSGSLVRNES